jgi:hypothetical protein
VPAIVEQHDTDGNGKQRHRASDPLINRQIGNSRMVPSGIVAVGHAQERSYAYAYSG